MKAFYIISLVFLSLLSHSQEKDEKPDHTKAWETLVQVAEKQDKEEILGLISGEIKNVVTRFGIVRFKSSVNKNYKQTKVFLKEGVVFFYLVNNKQKFTALFELEDKRWKFYEMRRGYAKSKLTPAQSSLQKQYAEKETEIISEKLSKIHHLITQFIQNSPDRILKEHKKMGISDRTLTFRCPREDIDRKILIVKGYKFTNKANNILAVTESKLIKNHIALFDDGHIEKISPKKFNEHASDFGLGNKSASSLSNKDKENIDKLSEKLGADSFKERKQAKESLLKFNRSAKEYLSVILKNTEDIEIKESLKEILTKLKDSSPMRKIYKK